MGTFSFSQSSSSTVITTGGVRDSAAHFPSVGSRGRSGRTNILRLRVRGEAVEGGVSMATEKLGITVERNPPESKLSQLGVKQWPKWGCPPSKFPWTYSAKETCYLLQGKVKVTPDGANDFVEIQAGDLVVFPKAMKCTWDVSETVDKHYKFD